MNRLGYFALAFALVMLAASSSALADSWSKPQDGVRGRLVITPGAHADNHSQITISLELENVSDVGTPITIAAGSPSTMLELSLEDENGKTIPRTAVGGNELAILQYVQALPWRSSLRIELASNAYEYVPSGRVLLRPFSLTAWEIPAKHGKLYLSGKLSPVNDKSVTGKWRGPLQLPRVQLP